MTTIGNLARSAHPMPVIAVTVLTAALAISVGGFGTRILPVVLAVVTGQLVVGWTNDIIDRDRDAASGRRDKPIAMGLVSPAVAVRFAVGTFIVCVVASLACGVVPGAIHLVFGVGSAVAYNAGVKSTLWSWAPYTVAFGALPAVVYLSVGQGFPPLWMAIVGGLLGFGAHLVNVLPDLYDDAATGVHGFPHRLPQRTVAPVAATVLVLASIVGLLGSGSARVWIALPVVLVFATAACLGRGKIPFYAAVMIAAVDVAVLVLADG